MLPTLPQNDRDSERRRLRISRARREYRFSYVYPKDVAVCARVPERDQFTMRYLAAVLKVQMQMLANHQFANLTVELDSQDGGTQTGSPAFAALSELKSNASGRLFQTAGLLAGSAADDIKAQGLDDFEAMYGVIAKPPIVAFVAGSAKEQDLAFAWQRIAGANPMVLQRVVLDRWDNACTLPQLSEIKDQFPAAIQQEVFGRVAALREAPVEEAAVKRRGARAGGSRRGAGFPVVPGVKMPDRFRFDPSMYATALAALGEDCGDSYAQAMAEGRLFVADYEVLEDIVGADDAAPEAQHGHLAREVQRIASDLRATGFRRGAAKPTKRRARRYAEGAVEIAERLTPPRQRMYAPIALFAWLPANARRPGRLVPIAVQPNQHSDDVFTPQPDVSPDLTEAEARLAESRLTAWKMARTCVQVADGTHHEMIAHLGSTHMMLEVTIVSAYRNLFENHPLRVLLEPHFEFTLPLNDTAVHNLIAPGGQVDQMLGGSLAESLAVLKKGLTRFRPDLATPRRELFLRGVLDWRSLPEFPYRDDVLPVWDAIHEFVSSYVRLYYGCDADVQHDPEVRDWLSEVGSLDVGKIEELRRCDTVAELIDFVAFIIFTASAQHAAVNFPQFPLMGYAPNLPGAGYAAAPTRACADAGEYTEADWLGMLPPLRAAMMQFNVLLELSSVRVNQLGKYSRLQFLDPRGRPLVKRFQRQLADVERATADRDRTRLISYPYLKPSQIPASIHI